MNHLEKDVLHSCVYHGGRIYETCTGHTPITYSTHCGYHVVITTYDSCVAAYTSTVSITVLFLRNK